jgi:hypothetical protein
MSHEGVEGSEKSQKIVTYYLNDHFTLSWVRRWPKAGLCKGAVKKLHKVEIFYSLMLISENDISDTVKLGYNELHGTINICSL